MTVVEANDVFSYGACGMPYVLSGDIEEQGGGVVTRLEALVSYQNLCDAFHRLVHDALQALDAGLGGRQGLGRIERLEG